jgi:hypothetical protein
LANSQPDRRTATGQTRVEQHSAGVIGPFRAGLGEVSHA